MAAGKDYFTDKAPLTTLEQLSEAKKMVQETGKKYSERIHVEAAVFAEQLIKQGAIGVPIHVEGFGSHRIGDIKSIIMQCTDAKISAPWDVKAEISTGNGFPQSRRKCQA